MKEVFHETAGWPEPSLAPTASWHEESLARTAGWLEQSLAGEPVEVELGCLIAAASGLTEDETELDDLVCGLVETGRITLEIG